MTEDGMKKLQVFGPGCAKCRDLAANVAAAAKELGIEHELVKVTAINDIAAAGVMMTPALAVDGKVLFSGKVPSVGELKKLLK